MEEKQDQFLMWALHYGQLGLAVFPCRPGGKEPITPHGFKDATSDFKQIEAWWRQYPRANIGIATGAVSSLLVIDVDPRNGGEASLEELQEKYGDLPNCPIVITGGGGQHYYLRHPGGNIRCGPIAQGIDIKADGGYVIAPPSVHPDGPVYRWDDSATLGEVWPGSCPSWMAELLAKRAEFSQPAPTSCEPGGNVIPNGQRNRTLTSLAGTMRRVGMTVLEIEAALTQINADRCRPPLNQEEIHQIAASVARYEPDSIATAVMENHFGQLFDKSPPKSRPPKSLGQLIASHPSLRKPIIEGLLREGETMNIISSPKIGKSWLVIDLALAVATGRPWLGMDTIRGDVLLIDNELHAETSANRIPKVAAARGIDIHSVAERIHIENLRGRLQDLFALGPYFKQFEPGRFKVVILDAFYRFLPMKADENDNGTMANLYNYLDSFADFLKCSFILIHHTSKGNQSFKDITDVGAGAGSQSRATDTHLVLRRHEQEDAVVLDAAVRSWPPLLPRCLRWAWPVWLPADDLDPTQLRQEGKRRKSSEPESEAESEEVMEWSATTFVEAFVTSNPKSKAGILVEANDVGLSDYKAERLLQKAEARGLIHRWNLDRNKPGYATVAQPILEFNEEEAEPSKRELVEQMLRENPPLNTNDIAEQCGVSTRYVQRIRREQANGEANQNG